MQQVQASLLPFHLHRKTLEVPEGLTLHEIVEHLFPHKIAGIKIVVNIGDEVVPLSAWKNVRPKSHTLVGINAIAAGGGGKKNPLAIIITIALIIAAPYIVGALAPGLAAGTGIGLTVAEGVVRIGISMVGFLAVSMLSSVPKQNSSAQAASAQEPSAQFIEGASNKIDRYGVIPVNLGVNRMFPPQAAMPYTETIANKQYVRQMFTYGFGKVQISDRRIGETSLSEYDGVEINDRLNGDLVDGVNLYTNDVFQEGYSVLVSNATGYITRTTQRDIDEADVDITFAQGLTGYNDSAQRTTQTVQFEIRYAPTGTTNWINRATSVTYASQSAVAAFPSAWNTVHSKRIGYGILVLNLSNGVVTAIEYDVGSSPIIPTGSIRIASFRTESTSAVVSGGTANILDLIDERASHVPSMIVNPTDFAFTYGGTGLSITVAGGTVAGSNTGVTDITVTDATAQALRVTKHIKFPTNGQWDIQVKRLTADSVSDRIRDLATLTAIRSIKYGAPVLQPDISGTALRLLATDQLNGTVDSYNVVVSTLSKDYDADLDTWVEDAVTSNPASIYRYVLQSPGFVKNLPDDRINIEKLEEWHIYCKANNLTYNKVIDYATSIDDLLNDIAAAGMATTHKINGIYSVLIDNERDSFKGMVTPRNSWGYNGSITYPDLPHALRVQFRNSAGGYNTDERIVYADGYTEETATLYERLQFDSCTNSDLAWFYGRRYMATVLLQPEVHTFNMDFENLTFNRGDKIVFVNDSILVGVGSGRIKELVYDGPHTHVTGFIIDDTVNIPTANQFGVRIRYSDASGFIYHSLTTTIGDTSEFVFATPVLVASAPPLDSLCAFTEFGKELELIITQIQMNKDHSARITAVNYAPERFDATSGAIPPFSSNITLSSDFYRPVPPELSGDVQSDENVMIKNSDGSYISRMLIHLINRNEPSVNVVVRARAVGSTQFFSPDLLNVTPELVVLTGLEDGMTYDFRISYQRQGGLQLMSSPLSLNNTTYIGASTKPDDVTNFQVSVSDSLGIFQWDSNTDIDLSHYVIRFTRLTVGATWESAQTFADNVINNRLNTPIQTGTYLIKAVDILGNESINATIIISNYSLSSSNVIQTLTQDSTWYGAKTNVEVDGSSRLILTDPTLVGYYYFYPSSFDVGDVYESIISSAILAGGIFYDPTDSDKIRSLSSIRSTLSMRGTDALDWAIFLENRFTNDAPYTDPSNLWTFAEDFSNAVYTKTRSSVTTDVLAALDFTTTVDKLTEDGTAANTHYIKRPFGSSIQTVTHTIYVKAAGRTKFRLEARNNAETSTVYYNFDLTAGTVDAGAVTGSGVKVGASIENCGNGWFKCQIIANTGSATNGWIYLFLADAGGSITYNGGSTNGLYLWEAQLRSGTAGYAPDWGDGWIPFTVGKKIFRGLGLRIRMESYNVLVTPFVSEASVTVDMPDRVEKDVGVSCSSVSGATIVYSTPFKASPSVNITLQNGAVDDKIEYLSKTNEGFQIKVYNATTAGYVTRTFDYVAVGYGRLVS